MSRFDSNMIPEEEQVKRGQPRLLDVDNPLVRAGRHHRARPDHRHRRDAQLVRAVGFGVQKYAVVGPHQRELDPTSTRKASTTASAIRSAASTTPSCRSRSRWSRRTISTSGSPAKKKAAQGRCGPPDDGRSHGGQPAVLSVGARAGQSDGDRQRRHGGSRHRRLTRMTHGTTTDPASSRAGSARPTTRTSARST